MDIGMMWFDNSPKKSLSEKVQDAAEYYFKKYNVKADLCFVNPSAMTEPEVVCGDVIVKPLRSILPGHLWIGRNEDKIKVKGWVVREVWDFLAKTYGDSWKYYQTDEENFAVEDADGNFILRNNESYDRNKFGVVVVKANGDEETLTFEVKDLIESVLKKSLT